MRGKIGSGHFEMITGFMFFMGFVIFLFMFISPWDNLVLSRSGLKELYDVFSEEAGTNLSTVFVRANYTGSGDCFYIDLPEDFFSYAVTGEDSLVTRLGGLKIDSDLDNTGKLNLMTSDKFFRVAVSPEFDGDAVSNCDKLNDFELGGVIELNVISYSKLLLMKEKYYSDYNGVRDDLKVAPIFDFAIVPEDISEAVMKPEGGVPTSAEVFARDYVVKVLKSDGSISNERISFRIW